MLSAFSLALKNDDPRLLPGTPDVRVPGIRAAVAAQAIRCLKHWFLSDASSAKRSVWRHAAVGEALRLNKTELLGSLLEGWKPTPKGSTEDALSLAISLERPEAFRIMLAAGWPLASSTWMRAIKSPNPDFMEMLRERGFALKSGGSVRLESLPPQTWALVWARALPAERVAMARARLKANLSFPQRLKPEWALIKGVVSEADLGHWITFAIAEDREPALRWGWSVTSEETRQKFQDRWQSAILNAESLPWKSFEWLNRNKAIRWTVDFQETVWKRWFDSIDPDRVPYSGTVRLSESLELAPSQVELNNRDRVWFQNGSRTGAPAGLDVRGSELATIIRYCPALFIRKTERDPMPVWERVVLTLCAPAVPYFKAIVKDWEVALRLPFVLAPTLYENIAGAGVFEHQKIHLAWLKAVLSSAPNPLALDRPSRGVVTTLIVLQAPVDTICEAMDKGYGCHGVVPHDRRRLAPVWAAMRGGSDQGGGWSVEDRRRLLCKLYEKGEYAAHPTGGLNINKEIMKDHGIEFPTWLEMAEALKESQPEAGTLMVAVALEKALEASEPSAGVAVGLRSPRF